MPGSNQEKVLNYNANDLFNIVLDIESYPDFIPWCSASRIISKKNNQIIADLLINYKNFNEKFRSYVEFDENQLLILVNYTEGPLKSLNTKWKFKKINQNKTLVNFDIEIKFKVSIFNRLLKDFYKFVENKMIIAFEKRASLILNTNKK